MASPQALTPVPVVNKQPKAAAGGGGRKTRAARKAAAAAAEVEEEEEQQQVQVKMPKGMKAWKVKVNQSPLDSNSSAKENQGGAEDEGMMVEA